MPQIIDLGKIRFSYQGAYSASVQYVQNDVVTYGANAYVYTNTTASTGSTPTNTTYWSVMTAGLQFEGTWSASASYQANDIVTFGGKSYVALQDNTNQDPTEAAYWDVIADGIHQVGAWSASTDYYYPGDVVTRGGSQYIALTYHEPTASFASDLANDDWEEFIRGTRFRGTWTADTAYLKDDIVSDGVNTHIATTDFTSNSVSFANETGGNWTEFTEGSSELPAQLNKEGYLLVTDGTNPLWTQDLVISGSANVFLNPFLAGPSAVFASETPSLNPNASAYLLEDYGLDEIPAGLTNPVAFFSIDTSNTANPAVNSEGDYAQFTVQNFSQGTNASTDIIANADIGDDETGWIDMGITSSNFLDEDFTITGPHDGYIFMSAPIGTEGDGNLVLATGSTGQQNNIVFAAGGLDSNATQMVIVPDTQVHIEIATESNSPTTGALAVAGGVGISGNANILGDVFINGSLQVSGGAFETQTLVSSAPLFTTGTGATDDSADRGFLVESKTPSSSATFEIGTLSASGGVGTVTRIGYTTLTKGITDNVATITIQEASHSILEGETVTLANLGSPYDGTHEVTAVTGTTFSYAAVGANQSPTADTDGTVVVSVPTEFIVGDRITVADSDITEFNGNRDFILSVSGDTITFDFNGSQALTSASGTVTVDTKTKYSGLVRNTTNDEWYLIANYPTLASGASRVAPSTDIDFSLAEIEYPTLNVGSIKFLNDANGSVDNILDGNINFPGNITLSGSANVLSGTFTGNPTISGNPTFSGAPVFSGQPVFTGGIRVQEMVEDVVDVSPSSNIYTLDYTTGNIFYSTGALSGNFTVNMTNVPTEGGRIITINMITTQGATGYIPGTLNINGSGVTIKWAGGVTPTPTSSSGKLDIFSFTIVRRGGVYECLASANLNF
jgi:hypothetical protein